jgi:hypothetical protein
MKYILNNIHVRNGRYWLSLLVAEVVRKIVLDLKTLGMPYRVHISPLHICIMIQVIPIHIFKTHFLKITLMLAFLSYFIFSSDFPTKYF